MSVDLPPDPPSGEIGDSRASRKEPSPPGTGKMGMWVLLASLAVLFVASIVGFLVVRLRAEAWPPPGMPRLPGGLWFATLVIVCCSVAIHLALVSIRRGQITETKVWLAATFALGILFLAVQGINWYGLIQRAVTAKTNLYAFTFFMLTGLHAAHVVGGLIPLGVVVAKAVRERYGSGNHPGILYMAMYWHFLDVVWIVLLAVLILFA